MSVKPAIRKMRTTTPLAERLEQARIRAGYSTVRDFHEAVGGPHSYEATRTWHNGRSRASAEYLHRVAELTGEPIGWLVTGDAEAGAEMNLRIRLRALADALPEGASVVFTREALLALLAVD